MSWLRFPDDFSEWAEWDMASTDVRWAYVCLVQACSRGKYWDGRLPKKKALASLVAQVDNPQQCLERLAMSSLVHELRREQVIHLPRIHDHVPPPGVRLNSEKSKVRMRRKRAHDVGDHSLCLDSCPGVTRNKTRNTGRNSDGLVTRHDAADSGMRLHDERVPEHETSGVTGLVTGLVTRNTRTGQDRTKEVVPPAKNENAS
jgi:hypothetical protein